MSRPAVTVLVFVLSMLVTVAAPKAVLAASSEARKIASFPRPLESYDDQGKGSVGARLVDRVRQDPLNLVATTIFLFAIVHTFLTPRFARLSSRYEQQIEASEKQGVSEHEHDRLVFKAQIYHFMGEVEAVFGIWLIPLFIAIVMFRGWKTMVDYVGHVDVGEAVFVVVIMAMASSSPVMRFAEHLISLVAAFGRSAPVAWWLAILTIGPLLGSFVTEAAAMTICALLLKHRFYNLKPSTHLKYATLGLLFVNVSIGGTLSHFAAPPVVMVAEKWNWDLTHMATRFGWKAALGIVLSNLIYLAFYRRELMAMKFPRRDRDSEKGLERSIPGFIIIVNLLFLVWTVANAHYPVLVMLGFLFFLAFVSATRRNQQPIALRPPLLVGFFLTALIIHGGCQQWWIAPVLGGLGRWPLMIVSTVLTAFNDNAAITYLASLVPTFTEQLKHAVMAGAIAGGGLTVIANAPNPAGQSILASRFGEGGISPLGLFAAALLPTIIAGACFMLL